MSTVRTTSMAQDEDFEAVKHWAITHTPSLHECFAASSRLENQRAELRRTRDHKYVYLINPDGAQHTQGAQF